MLKPDAQQDARPHVLLVTGSQELADITIEVLHKHFGVSVVAPTDGYLETLSQATAPDIYIVDIDDTDWLLNGAMANVETIRSLSPDTPIIVTTFDLSTSTIIPAMRAGANDVLDKQSSHDEIFAMVDHHAHRRPVRHGDRNGEVLAFWAPCAGIGATTFAIASSQAICNHDQFEGRLLYLDFSMPPSEVADVVGLTPAYSMCDALSDLTRFDDTLIESAIASVDGRFYLLPFALNETSFDAELLGQVPNLISVLRSYFNYVVIDCHRAIAPLYFDRMFCDADVSVLCTDQSLTTIHACAARLSNIREKIRVGFDYRLVITRYDPDIAPDAKQIMSALPTQHYAHTIPFDRRHVDGRRNSGLPLVDRDSRSNFQRSVWSFLAEIDEKFSRIDKSFHLKGFARWRELLHLQA